MTNQLPVGRRKLRPAAIAVTTLTLTAFSPLANAADAITFNGNNSYAQIQPWQPKGHFKVIAWLGDLNPDDGAKTMLLSSSASSEYLAFSHNSVQGQFGREYPGIWGQFRFAETKYIEIEIQDGKLIASDGLTKGEIYNKAIDADATDFDWLFRRGGGFSSGAIEGLALIDLNNPENSRAFAFDQDRGMVEVDGEATPERLVNVADGDWQSGIHSIHNPAPGHFDENAWQAAFYPDDLTPNPEPTPEPTPNNQSAVRFDGKHSYASMSSWVPSGKFRLIAHLAEVTKEPGQWNMLLTSSNTTEYLAFTHNNVQGKWGNSFPGMWAGFDFPNTKYLELIIDHGVMTASDGNKHATVRDGNIDPTRVAYDWFYRRGNGFGDGALQSVTLIDENNPANSRSFAFDSELGMVEVNGHHGQLHGVNAGSWIQGQHQISNPAPEHFAQEDWERVYGGGEQPDPNPEPTPDPNPEPTPDPDPTPEPDPDPTPEPDAQQYALAFNGSSSFGRIPEWRPSGKFQVIAELAEVNASSGSNTYLLSDSANSNYLAFTHHNAQGQWGSQYPGVWGQFNFDDTKYVAFTIEQGKMTISDGQRSATVKNNAINPTLLSYDWVFRRGGAYSQGALQSLTLLDLNNPANSRSYAFKPELGMVEVNGHDGELIGSSKADYQLSEHIVENPAPDHFPQEKWDSVYGGGGDDDQPIVPEPDPTPDPNPDPDPTPDPNPEPDPTPEPGDTLLGEHDRAIRFNGHNAYFDFADWQPEGEHRVVAWIRELNEQLTYLASASNGYLAVTQDDFVARFNGQEVRLDNQFAFAETGYVEIVINGNRATVSDGQHSVSVNHNAIANQRYVSAMRFGNDYSHGSLQALALLDFSSDDRLRAYTFNDQFQIIENSKQSGNQNRLYNVANNEWHKVEDGITAPSAELASKAEWDASFDHTYRYGRPLLDGTRANDNGEFAWHGHYWLRAYLTMAETYQDDKYLGYAIELIDHMVNYTDDKRAARGEINIYKEPYSSAPKAYLNDRSMISDGWRRPYGGYRMEVLADGQILNAIMRVVDYIKRTDNSQYMAKADHYLGLARTVIAMHDSSFSVTKNAAIQGSYFYVNDQNDRYGDSGLYSNPLPFNHNMTLAVAMIYVDKWSDGGEPAMAQKVRDIIGFFNDNLIYNSDGTCTWNYAYDVTGNNKLEDSNHAHMDVGFLLAANSEGYTDDKPLKCMARTLTDKVFVAPGVIAFDVEGNGIGGRWDQVASSYDWADLAEYDSRITELNLHVLRNFGDPTWSRAYLGWATMLKWQQ